MRKCLNLLPFSSLLGCLAALLAAESGNPLNGEVTAFIVCFIHARNTHALFSESVYLCFLLSRYCHGFR